MSHVVNNGSRVQVEHPLYSGTAGMVKDGGDGDTVQIAFTCKDQPEGEITIDGEPWLIVASRRSRTARAMAVLTVSAVTGNGGEE